MWTKVLIVTLCVIGVALAAENAPVFLWGHSSTAKPSLRTVQREEFADLISPLLKDHMIVAFQEDKLSTNDFLCANAETAQSCYAQLQGVSPKTYYASVEHPIEALRSVATEREFNNVNSAGKLETPIDCATNKVVFVNFDSTGKNRALELEEHDAAIASISKSLSSCPTVFLYTSVSASESRALQAQSRVRRATAAPEGGYIFSQPNQFLLFFTSLSIVTTNSQNQATTTPVTVTGMTVTNVTTTQFNVNLATDNGNPVTFEVFYTAGYFNMTNLQYDNTTYFTQKVYAPTTFSYYCGNLSLAATSAVQTQAVLWNSFQMQAPFGSGINSSVFAEPWDCVGFVTPGITMGLFVVALFLIIIFTGICWMMDINTMDRFDDPKGKTITINAGE